MGGIISSLAQDDSYHLWYHYFGHLSRNALYQATSKVSGIPTVIISPSLAPCKGCALGKMYDCPYALLDKWATRPLALVHTNVVGPMPMKPHLQSYCILTFIDNFSGYALVAFICTKDTVPQHLAWFPGLRPLLVTCSPLFILTEEGNFWVKTYNHSSHPEVSLIRPPFPILLSRMVV